jgi:hypothetical protein
MIVTDPLPNPTATCDKSSRAAKADIGNGLRAFCIDVVDKQRGTPVFFSVLSSAHTFSTGSLGRSSAIVISSDVPSICLICVMEALSAALKDRTILNPAEMMCTTPSVDAMKRLEEPALRDVRSD